MRKTMLALAAAVALGAATMSTGAMATPAMAAACTAATRGGHFGGGTSAAARPWRLARRRLGSGRSAWTGLGLGGLYAYGGAPYGYCGGYAGYPGYYGYNYCGYGG